MAQNVGLDVHPYPNLLPSLLLVSKKNGKKISKKHPKCLVKWSKNVMGLGCDHYEDYQSVAFGVPCPGASGCWASHVFELWGFALALLRLVCRWLRWAEMAKNCQHLHGSTPDHLVATLPQIDTQCSTWDRHLFVCVVRPAARRTRLLKTVWTM